MADITLAWSKSADFYQIVKLFESSNPKIIVIYSKGLAIWPGSPKYLSDQITCRFIANNEKKTITNSNVNNLVVEENNFDVVRIDKLYLYEGGLFLD